MRIERARPHGEAAIIDDRKNETARDGIACGSMRLVARGRVGLAR